MSVVQTIFGVLLALFCIVIILVVLLQEGHQKNLGAITGGADTFFEKNKARSIDSFLARWTKIITVAFFVVVIVINAIAFFQ
ncbi:MAG TPA: preprotein translocase subunit SecG [Candidatus Gallacutalibacter stercoravium]|nr:preprotein translocase subunit SecG [Candidatus Gallacutalibacter stercoravium]